MKKFIAGFILFALTVAYAMPTLADDSIKTTTENVIQTVQDTDVNANLKYVTEKLEAFVKSFKAPAEHVYKILVKKQVLAAWSEIFLLVLSIIIGLILIITPVKIMENKNSRWREANKDSRNVKDNPNYNYHDWNENPPLTISVILGCFVLFPTFIIILIDMSDIIQGLFNPEYGAIKEIMSIF